MQKEEIERLIRQKNHEIQWAKDKIKSLPLNKQKQIRDLERQVREREYDIVFLKQDLEDLK
jgi:hypothetical protein